jgi:hypothetical protein
VSPARKQEAVCKLVDKFATSERRGLPGPGSIASEPTPPTATACRRGATGRANVGARATLSSLRVSIYRRQAASGGLAREREANLSIGCGDGKG